MTTTESRHPDTLSETAVEREALDRIARANVDRFAEIRTAAHLAAAGYSQRNIARIMHTTQPRVHRMLAAADTNTLDFDLDEIIYRAHLDRTDRSDLIETLKNYPYTFGWRTTDTPLPEYVCGTWDQIPTMYDLGFLTLDEFTAIADHVAPDA